MEFHLLKHNQRVLEMCLIWFDISKYDVSVLPVDTAHDYFQDFFFNFHVRLPQSDSLNSLFSPSNETKQKILPVKKMTPTTV